MELKPFSIGKTTVSPNLILAPMSGVTNICFRQLIKQENPGSVGLLVTEFISIEGLTRKNEKSIRMMDFDECERPLSVQVFGHEISRMVDAALMAEDRGADILDINCGCPVPKVVKKGGGCELMRQPEHLGRMLEAVAKALSIPLTLKIRSGWGEDSRNALEIAKIAENAGVQMLAMHGRTRTQMYRDKCDWSAIEAVAKSVSIPVVGSGDIVDVTSAQAALRSGVKGLMIGRAALTNPWVFSEIASAIEGRDYQSPSLVETPRILATYCEMLRAKFPDTAVLGRLKQLASQVTRRVPRSAPARKALCTSKSVDEYLEVVDRWREYLSGSSTSTAQDAQFESTNDDERGRLDAAA